MSDIVRILAFDPGLANCGWSLHEYNTKTGQDVVVQFGTILGRQAIKARKQMAGVFENRFIILCELKETVMNMLKEFTPDFVCHEGAFQHRYPDAYLALGLVIHTIREACYLVMGWDIYSVAPMEAKKAISTDGTANKDVVQKAVVSHPKITVKDRKQNPVADMTEHAADSIAIGWAFTQNQLATILAALAALKEQLKQPEVVADADKTNVVELPKKARVKVKIVASTKKKAA